MNPEIREQLTVKIFNNLLKDDDLMVDLSAEVHASVIEKLGSNKEELDRIFSDMDNENDDRRLTIFYWVFIFMIEAMLEGFVEKASNEICTVIGKL